MCHYVSGAATFLIGLESELIPQFEVKENVPFYGLAIYSLIFVYLPRLTRRTRRL